MKINEHTIPAELFSIWALTNVILQKMLQAAIENTLPDYFSKI
jgi:hypothetical protein